MPQRALAEAAVPTLAGTAVIKQCWDESLKNTNSLLSSSLEQIINGDFVWHGSDISGLITIGFVMLNVFIAYRKFKQDQKRKPDSINWLFK